MRSNKLRELEYLKGKLKKQLDKKITELDHLETSIANINKHMNWPVAIMMNVICICAILIEISYGIEIYYDAAHEMSGIIPPSLIIVLLVSTVVGSGALSAHFLGVFMNNDFKALEIALLQEKGLGLMEAKRSLKKRKSSNLSYGLLFGLLAISIVFFFSYKRVLYYNQIYEGTEGWTNILMPCIFVIAEILTGIFLIVSVKVLILKKRLSSLKNNVMIIEQELYNIECVIEEIKNTKPDFDSDLPLLSSA